MQTLIESKEMLSYYTKKELKEIINDANKTFAHKLENLANGIHMMKKF